MRTVEEIRADVADYIHDEEIYKAAGSPRTFYGRLPELYGELRAAITAGIDPADLARLCDAWRSGQLRVTETEIILTDRRGDEMIMQTYAELERLDRVYADGAAAEAAQAGKEGGGDV
jgi:hypothetical protein